MDAERVRGPPRSTLAGHGSELLGSPAESTATLLPISEREHEVVLRLAEETDAVDIATIWLDCLSMQGSHKAVPGQEQAVAAFKERIRHPQDRSCIWVAVENGYVIGWQSLSDFGVTQITKAGMSSTYVSPRCHTKGLGRRLLAHATGSARSCGFDYVVGFIRTDNVAPIKIVLSLGWKLVGTLPRNLDDGAELAYYAYAVPASPAQRSRSDIIDASHYS
jgi:L-amino acid N-acyltransferase YncA